MCKYVLSLFFHNEFFFSQMSTGLDVFYVGSVCAADGTSALSSLPLPSVAGVCLSPDEAAHSCTALQTSTVDRTRSVHIKAFVLLNSTAYDDGTLMAVSLSFTTTSCPRVHLFVAMEAVAMAPGDWWK